MSPVIIIDQLIPQEDPNFISNANGARITRSGSLVRCVLPSSVDDSGLLGRDHLARKAGVG